MKGGGGEMMTPKQIAKYLKSKGYGKPWLYCQVCRKQCRDDNGFKCHTESIQHLRNIEVFMENQDTYIAAYSAEFERGMLDVMRTTFQNQKVYITTVHRVYSRARSQVRLNGTRWATLEEFCDYLAKTGKAEVFQTDKGPEVLYTGKDLEQERLVKEREVMKNEQDRLMQEIENRIKKTQEMQKQAETQPNNENNHAPETKGGEIDLEKKGEIKFALKVAKKDSVPVNKTEKENVEELQEITIAPTKQSEGNLKPEPSKESTKLTPMTKSEEKKRKEPEVSSTAKNASTESKKKKSNRKENWICPGIVVKILNKNLQEGKFYKQKGVIEKVIDDFVALVRVLDLNLKIKIDQAELETVIPRIGNQVQVVNGTYRGETATLMAIDEQKYRAQVKIETGPQAGALSWEEYEDICKLHTE